MQKSCPNLIGSTGRLAFPTGRSPQQELTTREEDLYEEYGMEDHFDEPRTRLIAASSPDVMNS